MGKIYKSQTQLRIRLITGVDITGATVVKIKYEKPDNTSGDWDATVEDATEGIIYYDVSSINDLDQIGEWKFWAYITFIDGRSAPGETVKEYIYGESE